MHKLACVGYLQNYNIINITNKNKPREYFDDINKLVLDSISDNMEPLVQTGTYGAISTTYTKMIGYYIVRFLTNTVTLKEYKTTYGKLFIVGKISIKSAYIRSIKPKMDWY